MAIADDLSTVSLFEGLTEAERRELASWFDEVTVSSGVTLAGEGAAGYSFYVLIEGSAVVTTDGVAVATYSTGDFFGEMALLGDGRRTATVTTTAPSRLLVMFGTEFRRLEASKPEIAGRLEKAMERRRHELRDLHSTT